jgi:transcription elongation factor GreA
MDNNADYITAEKKAALEAELQELSTTKRKEVLEALEFAKSLGDLSENAEYHQAREEQAKLEDRIQKVEHILKSSIVVKKHHSTQVEIGSTVHVKKEIEKDTKKYQVVGSEEADMAQGKISHRSPLGEALFGKKKGDKVEFKTPSGVIHYTVVDIE